jgi:hypothetical protein
VSRITKKYLFCKFQTLGSGLCQIPMELHNYELGPTTWAIGYRRSSGSRASGLKGQNSRILNSELNLRLIIATTTTMIMEWFQSTLASRILSCQHRSNLSTRLERWYMGKVQTQKLIRPVVLNDAFTH